MAEKARLFHDHRALERMVCSSDPQSHERIGRSVRGFDHTLRERERENSVVAGTIAKFSQKPGDEPSPFGH